FVMSQEGPAQRFDNTYAALFGARTLSHQTAASGGQSRILDNSSLICSKRLARTSEAVLSIAPCTLFCEYRMYISRRSVISWRRLAMCDERRSMRPAYA